MRGVSMTCNCTVQCIAPLVLRDTGLLVSTELCLCILYLPWFSRRVNAPSIRDKCPSFPEARLGDTGSGNNADAAPPPLTSSFRSAAPYAAMKSQGGRNIARVPFSGTT